MNERTRTPLAVIGWTVLVCTFLVNAREIFIMVFIVEDYAGPLASRVTSLASDTYVDVLVAALIFAFGLRQVAGVLASAAVIGFFTVQSLVFTIIVLAADSRDSYSDPTKYAPNGIVSVLLCVGVTVGLVLLAKAIAPPKTPAFGAPQGFPGRGIRSSRWAFRRRVMRSSRSRSRGPPVSSSRFPVRRNSSPAGTDHSYLAGK
jgi:hypothetical protein